MPSGVAITAALVPSSISNSLRNFRGITSWPFTVKVTVSVPSNEFMIQLYVIKKVSQIDYRRKIILDHTFLADFSTRDGSGLASPINPALNVQPHELDPVIGFRVSRRRTGDEHHPFGGDSVFAHPVRGPVAPVIRFLGEIDRIHTVGEREILTRSAI